VAIALCLGAIISDTLFVFTGVPIAQIGSLSIVAYILVGVFAIIIALQLGELSSTMPHSKGGAYSYVTKSFGSELGFITGALLYLAYCAMTSVIALGFSGYLLSMLGISNEPLQIAVAVLSIIAISVVNMYGLRKTSGLTRILVTVALLSAAIFCIFSFSYGINKGTIAAVLTYAGNGGAGTFLQATTAIVFAYSSFQIMVTLADNIKEDGKGAAKIMAVSILLGAIAYVAVTMGLIALIAVPHAISANPLIYALSYVNAPRVIELAIGAGILFSIAAALIMLVFTSSRLVYEIGHDNLLPRISRLYDKEKGVATSGIWISALLSITLLFAGNIYVILSISNFGIIVSWAMACFALINMRRRNITRKFSSPYYPFLSILSIVVCIVLLFGLPGNSLAFGITIILLLLVIYYIIVEIKYKKVPRLKLFD
jgi:APA family basic amino acid/polyamine antiporter